MSALCFRHSFSNHRRQREILGVTETCLEAAVRQGIHARAVTDSFVSALFDAVEQMVSQPTFDRTSDTDIKSFLWNSGMDDFKSLCAGIIKRNGWLANFLFKSGIYMKDTYRYDSNALFISERRCFVDLLTELSFSCSCGMSRSRWILVSAAQVLYISIEQYTDNETWLTTERTCRQDPFQM